MPPKKVWTDASFGRDLVPFFDTPASASSKDSAKERQPPSQVPLREFRDGYFEDVVFVPQQQQQQRQQHKQHPQHKQRDAEPFASSQFVASPDPRTLPRPRPAPRDPPVPAAPQPSGVAAAAAASSSSSSSSSSRKPKLLLMGFEDVAELHSTVRGTKKSRKEKEGEGEAEGRDPSNELCRLLGIPAAR